MSTTEPDILVRRLPRCRWVPCSAVQRGTDSSRPVHHHQHQGRDGSSGTTHRTHHMVRDAHRPARPGDHAQAQLPSSIVLLYYPRAVPETPRPHDLMFVRMDATADRSHLLSAPAFSAASGPLIHLLDGRAPAHSMQQLLHRGRAVSLSPRVCACL
jgi:hypothetical protein